MGAEPIMSEVTSRLRRAIRHGTRLHLEIEHVRALMHPDVYGVLSKIEAEELAALCESPENQDADQSTPPPIDSKSVDTGFGTGLSATSGTFVGSKEIQHAAEQRALEAATLITRRKRQRTG